MENNFRLDSFYDIPQRLTVDEISPMNRKPREDLLKSPKLRA
jgi:hypothetical protein